jgi:hypothetical protein
MLIEKFEAYIEIQNVLQELEQAYVNSIKTQSDLKKALQEVLQSEQKIYGWFSQVTKDEKVSDLRSRMARVDVNVYTAERLLNLVSAILCKYEIPHIKYLKEVHKNELMEQFAKFRIKKIMDERNFWAQIIEKNPEEDVRVHLLAAPMQAIQEQDIVADVYQFEDN